MSIYYEYYIALDDGSFIGRNGRSVERSEVNGMGDPRAFFETHELAHLAGEGFVKLSAEEDGIEGVTYEIHRLTRTR